MNEAEMFSKTVRVLPNEHAHDYLAICQPKDDRLLFWRPDETSYSTLTRKQKQTNKTQDNFGFNYDYK